MKRLALNRPSLRPPTGQGINTFISLDPVIVNVTVPTVEEAKAQKSKIGYLESKRER